MIEWLSHCTIPSKYKHCGLHHAHCYLLPFGYRSAHCFFQGLTNVLEIVILESSNGIQSNLRLWFHKSKIQISCRTWLYWVECPTAISAQCLLSWMATDSLHMWVWPPTWMPFKGYSRSFPLAFGSIHFIYDHALLPILPVCVPLI